MRHFAYPNVIPREARFLGCGRYVAAGLGAAPDDRYELVELNIPNLTEVHLAAFQLAPEADESQQVIYERRDAAAQAYRGESRDFAYVLALISRSRALRDAVAELDGDIWCTGGIDIKGENQPFLKAVDVTGFTHKLEAFLAAANPDRLFFVPAPNVLPSHAVLFQQTDANVVSLSQFHQLSAEARTARKTIVKVQGDELAYLVAVLFNHPAMTIAEQPAIGRNPYRGLFAFREQDAEWFFGRDAYIQRLFDAVQRQPFVAVLGPSGSGKSSVVYAGLIPRLRHQTLSYSEGLTGMGFSDHISPKATNSPPGRGRGGLLGERPALSAKNPPLPLPGGESGGFAAQNPYLSAGEGQGWENWRIADFRPGSDPFRALAATLMPFLEPEYSERERIAEIHKMAQHLQTGRLHLVDVLAVMSRQSPHSRLLLFADQFEELYTLCRVETDRRRFLEELLNIIGAQPSVCHLVITMRADFLGKAYSDRPFADALQSASLILGPMQREELQEVIEKPARKCAVQIEAGLTGRMLDAISGAPGNLPLLEFALTQLWEKQAPIPAVPSSKGDSKGLLTHAAYDDLGGVAQALAGYAERVYATLAEAEQERAQQIFIQLVQPGEGTEDIRRTATCAEVGGENWDLVVKLADARLVITGSDERSANLSLPGFGQTQVCPPEETVDVVHEALIRGWQRLRTWMETDREFRLWQERLRAARLQWQRSHADQGALLRGVPLVEAEIWLNQKRSRLSSEEQRFIEASVQIHKKVQLGKRLGMLTLFLITLAIAFVLLLLLEDAERHRQLADTRALEALNQYARARFLAKDDELGALLAAIKTGQSIPRVLSSEKLRMQILCNLHEIISGIHEKNRLEGSQAAVQSVSFSPDGKLLASGSKNASITLWNVADGRERMTLFGHAAAVHSVCFSPDGALLASGSADHTIKLWKVADGSEVLTLRGHAQTIYSVSFSPDGKLLASGSADHAIKLWRAADGREIMTLTGHPQAVWDVSFSPDGAFLASGSADQTIKLWQVADGREVAIFEGHAAAVRSVRFSPDGKLLASGSNDHTIKLWNVAAGVEYLTLRGHVDAVRSVSFSPDGTLLASGGDELDGTLKLWDVADGRLRNTFKGHYNSVGSVHFSPDGELLASGSDDYTIKFWQVRAESELPAAEQADAITSVEFNHHGTILATGSADGTLTFWDAVTYRKRLTLQEQVSAVRELRFSPDDKLLAAANADHTVTLWQTADGVKRLTLQGHASVVRSISFSPNGKLLASGSDDRTIKLWNLANGQERLTFRGHADLVQSVCFSPDGKLLASGSADQTIKLWNVADGKERQTFPSGSALDSITFSPDGRLLASGGGDNLIKLWRVADGHAVRILKGHARPVSSVAFSPNGELLASGSQDNTVKLWHVADGSELLSLGEHAAAVNSVAFYPTGLLLASGSDDQRIKIWNFNLDDLLARGCAKLAAYIKTNPNVRAEDRRLCDHLLNVP